MSVMTKFVNMVQLVYVIRDGKIGLSDEWC